MVSFETPGVCPCNICGYPACPLGMVFFAFFLVCVLGGGCSNTLRCERAAASPTVWDSGRICERGLRKRKGLPERSGHGHRFQRPPARCHTRVVFKRSTGKRAFMWDEVVRVTATGQVWQRAARSRPAFSTEVRA